VQSSLLQAQIGILDFQAARYLMTGEVPAQVGNDHPVFMPTSAYSTRDGYLNLSAPGRLWKRLCDAIGRPELADMPEFATGAERSRNRDALKRALNAAFASDTTEAWIGRLNAAGVPCGPIYTLDETFADPQVEHLEAAATVRHGKLGDIRVVNQVVKLKRTPASMARPTPDKGEHTDEILAELGYAANAIQAFRAAGVI
jgi:formyl-CoA transferase